MNEEPKNWRALADSLTYAMTESGIKIDPDYARSVAQDAAAWLETHGYRIDRPADLNRPNYPV